MKHRLAVIALLAPASALMVVTFVLPGIWLARLSLDRVAGGGVLIEDVSADNYLRFFTDAFYHQILWRSLWMSVTVTLATLVCSYPIALFLFRTTSRWRGVLAVLTISPLLVSSVVRTFGWMVILGDSGLVNGLLRWLGLLAAPLPLMNNMLGVIIGLTQIEMPTMILALIAGFARLDTTLEEAARTLGAGRWRVFRRITVPQIAPGLAAGSLFAFMVSFDNFPISMWLSDAEHNPIPLLIFQRIASVFEPSVAAMSTLMILFAMAVVLAVERLAGLRRALAM